MPTAFLGYPREHRIDPETRCETAAHRAPNECIDTLPRTRASQEPIGPPPRQENLGDPRRAGWHPPPNVGDPPWIWSTSGKKSNADCEPVAAGRKYTSGSDGASAIECVKNLAGDGSARCNWRRQSCEAGARTGRRHG